MDLLSLLIVLIIVGALLYVVESVIPMDPRIKNLIVVVVIVAVVIYLLRALLGGGVNLRLR